ncbi:unnamed protein product [Cyclocybe aegerita]|uniref:Methyltransferase type 12 domain-containing protein n=1 Tax=Cyclocybe aegerita TaxID=1973307 RepID=A0A8S0W3G8_CYCAE|nr:unnamed protein product [Cyclocybe aegerita]
MLCTVFCNQILSYLLPVEVKFQWRTTTTTTMDMGTIIPTTLLQTSLRQTRSISPARSRISTSLCTRSSLKSKATTLMREHYAFDKNATTLMDFACGAGHISRGLNPYAKYIVGVDITQAAIDMYNERAAEKGVPPEEMRGVCADLKGDESELDGLKFDVIACSMSYHHFGSIEDITKMLAFFLKPGGALLVVDILHIPGSDGENKSMVPEKYHHVVAHTSGFKERIRAVFEGAGLTMTKFVSDAVVDFELTHSGVVTLFFTKAVKPSS